jgi:hypothetical protein
VIDVDSVAQAIFCANSQDVWRLAGPTPWEGLSERGQEYYRRMARAAIDALGLHVEGDEDGDGE